MAWPPEELKRVKAEVDAGKHPEATVRTLLGWFGFQRRGTYIVHRVRTALRQLGLVTNPDFDSVWIDHPVGFEAKGKGAQPPLEPAVAATISESPPVLDAVATTKPVAVPIRALTGQDPSYSVRKLEAANRPPVSVKPDTSISEAITIMLRRDFSQLPVMQGDRSVKGLFSWRSLGPRLALKCQCDKVSDAMDRVKTVSAEASIFQIAEIVAKEEVVLVQASASDQRITGILTTTDLTEQFGRLGEPFLLLGEIENRVRALIDGKFTPSELGSVRTPTDSERQIETVIDMNFGEYVRLLQDPKHWEKCKLHIDRATFTKQLDEVREIRNDVMHFDPDGIGPEVLESLRKFAEFLDRLARLGGS